MARMGAQVRTLCDAGADLRGMFQDAEIARHIDDGSWDVNTAYARWRGTRGARETAPVISARSTGGAVTRRSFADMTSAEFAAFCERVDRAVNGGGRVTL